MVPTAEMMVEAAIPQSIWKLPLAEIFAISAALLNSPISSAYFELF